MDSGLSDYNLGRFVFVFFFFKREPNNPLVSTFHVLKVVLRVIPMSFCLVLTNEEICGLVRLNNMPGKN